MVKMSPKWQIASGLGGIRKELHIPDGDAKLWASHSMVTLITRFVPFRIPVAIPIKILQEILPYKV